MTQPFTHDPPRLIESADLGLQHDLELARSARVDYSVEAGLARFESGLAGASALPGGTVGGFAVLRWFLGASTLLGVAVVAWLAMKGQPETQPGTRTLASVGAHEPNQFRSEDDAVAEIDSTTLAVASDASSVVGSRPESPPGSGARESVAETQQPDGDGQNGAAARSSGGDPAGQLAASPRPASKSSATGEPAVEEAKLIDAARKALAEDPAKTLELTEQAAERFPAGAMVQERRGYAILALIALDRRDEAEQRAAEYLERWPKGPLSRRIESALGDQAVDDAP